MGAGESQPKFVDVEVIRGSVGESSGALVTGLRIRQKITLEFRRPIQSRDQAAQQTAAEAPGYTMAAGAFKKAYKMDCNGRSYVLKVPGGRGTNLTKDCEDSEKAIQYATAFNARDPRSSIKFCAPVLVKVYAARDKNGHSVNCWVGREAMVEPYLEGDYDKFVFNLRIPRQVHELAEAFFHFTYHYSGHREIIWDLQGVNKSRSRVSEYHLTDPYIIENRHEAKNKFKILHADHFGCNKHCEKHGLPKGN